MCLMWQRHRRATPLYEEQRVDLRRVVGVDLSGDMLAFARKRFPVSTFVQADFLDLEQEDVGGGLTPLYSTPVANLYDQAAAISTRRRC